MARERAVSPFGGAVQGIGPGLQQEAGARYCGLVAEGSASVLVLQVDLGAHFQKDSHDVDVVVLRCRNKELRSLRCFSS